MQNDNLVSNIIIFIITWFILFFIAIYIDLTYNLIKSDIYVLASMFTAATIYIGSNFVDKFKEYSSFTKQIR